MNKFNKLSIISLVVVFFCFVNVFCIRNKDKAPDSFLQNNLTLEDSIRSNFSSFLNESTSLETVTDNIAQAFVNELFVQLNNKSKEASFLQTEFNIKAEMKKQAKNLFLVAMKQGLEPVETLIAESIKPPTLKPHAYSLVSKVLMELFNHVEKKLKIPVSDEIWMYEDNNGSDEEDSFNDEDFDNLN
ncbi:cell traversal protein for ookinetes and sporozoites, putative [Hepatocystis sp. ex Piliocolobus tephrosceles]|nr:cell traversal protein for ookinetes and sporozoites, putative [Hepatocystis sp. ex Piliocolobus tephrosceles]